MRTFTRRTIDRESRDYEICDHCAKHIRDHFGGTNYRCDPIDPIDDPGFQLISDIDISDAAIPYSRDPRLFVLGAKWAVHRLGRHVKLAEEIRDAARRESTKLVEEKRALAAELELIRKGGAAVHGAWSQEVAGKPLPHVIPTVVADIRDRCPLCEGRGALVRSDGVMRICTVCNGNGRRRE